MAVLLPYLDEQADGRVVLTSKGTLAKFLQATAGDALLNLPDGALWTVEIKAEERHTGNLFLEVWSNKNLRDRASYCERGSTMGWLYTCRADLLMYWFEDTDDLYTINLWRLKRWAFGVNGDGGRIYQFTEREQNKYAQMNDTHGRLVPISVLRDEVRLRQCKVKQLALFAAEVSA